MSNSQADIKNWFEEVYKSRGFDYLRPREAYEIFATLLTPDANTKHLDVACGLGLLLKVFHEKGAEVYGIDISEEAVKQSKLFCPEALLAVGNAEELPYENETFNSVTCIGSLERMINREVTLREQIRVTKKDGRLCYMVRNSENFTWKYILKPFGLDNKKGHQDAMNLEEWEQLFIKCGLKIIGIYPDHWPFYRTISMLQPWKKINTGRIRKFPFDINLAYEFIFLLSKE